MGRPRRPDTDHEVACHEGPVQPGLAAVHDEHASGQPRMAGIGSERDEGRVPAVEFGAVGVIRTRRDDIL